MKKKYTFHQNHDVLVFTALATGRLALATGRPPPLPLGFLNLFGGVGGAGGATALSLLAEELLRLLP
eukprot:CAMPEP_0184427706 /NCGR_PEP_ID=MMETSP0738-20130409/188229_1 /TAXON_ID=385413 /ORGANISM="Thalassiosira miniscula, Strain CCMP1093" /LENGTH=66 /DNA_ID=CAMNT_0026791365 /DNA_START=8 /DNA_END=208 /DNA_ORIENTATION=+